MVVSLQIEDLLDVGDLIFEAGRRHESGILLTILDAHLLLELLCVVVFSLIDFLDNL